MASKDTFDPGWNDPPTFTYDRAAEIQTAAANKKGNLLNKRVAFPMSGKVGNDQGNVTTSDTGKPIMMPPPLMPPPMASPLLSLPTEQQEKVASNEVKTMEKDKIDEVLKNLEIHTIKDDDILKRIRVMEKMWRDEKLDEGVKLKILELSQAIAENNVEAADHIQKSLMVDKISQCSSWMSGIRNIINQIKLKNS